MGAWTFGRVAGGAAVLVAVALAIWVAVPAAAQVPADPPPSKNPSRSPHAGRGENTPPDPDVTTADQRGLPKLNLPDESGVEQAQFTQPIRPAPGPTLPPGSKPPTPRPVADPPSAVVRIQVRVPSDAPPGGDLRYLITVQNTSQADAHQVTVRNPIPATVEKVVRAEPPPDPAKGTATQLVWSFNTLRPGDKRTIELVLKAKSDAKEVKNLAYVRFEHGEAVTTRLSTPAVKIDKTAPKETIRGEPFAVRVVVQNTGRVPAEGVRVVENVDRYAEVETITAGESRTKPDENQWQWEVGTLQPGERKTIEYRVTPRQSADVLTTTNVAATNLVGTTAEARTRVLTPGLGVKLTGPSGGGVVGPGQVANYEIVVKNTGTMASTNVQVVGTIPLDCKPTKKTEGGQLHRDAIVWTIPRLDPGVSHSFRFGLRASSTCQRKVAAYATDARKLRATDELTVTFEGMAALGWQTELDHPAVAVKEQATLTVTVTNHGGAEARNVMLEVDLPPEAALTRVPPAARQTAGKLVFGPTTLPAGDEQTYSITYQAKQSGRARIRAKLTADTLTQPMESDKEITISGDPK